MSRPFVPFRQFVLKVHSRCDLACDHCYVYEHADQSWRGRPKAISDEVVSWTAVRIAEHVKQHGLDRVHVVMHGGEPLLAGPARLGRIAAELRGHLDGLCELDLRIHTNGVLLDERFCEVFAEHGVKVGVSLDGDRAANDRHRRFADGRSSYDRVIRAVELLRTRPELYAGLLCTVDVANDPIAVYRGLVALEPPRIDFLLPHATWDDPPPRPTPTAYADWLITVFETWAAEGGTTPVRMFESIIRTTAGEPSLTESLGLQPSDLVVVETDGGYEQADSLKTAFDGAPETGLHVLRHTLDEVARHTGILARQQGLDGLCGECRACPVVDSCGGGLYAHRYRTGSGFANPSVFSADLFKLITHVRRRMKMHAPTHTVPSATIDTLASGLGGSDEVSHLAQSQRSLRRGLLAAVNAAVNAPVAGNAPGNAPVTAGGGAAAAWELISTLDGTHPEVVAAVLAHPYVRVWATECLRDGRHAGHLANIAAAMAIRAGVTAALDVQVIAGAVHLPTLGVLETDPGGAAPEAGGTARLETAGGTFALAGDGTPGTVTPVDGENGDGRGGAGRPGWHPVRRVSAGDFSVAIEDTDPFRDCHQWPAASRLTDDQAAAWQRAFEQAWALVESDHPDYAPGLRAGLTTLMPLTPGPEGREVSSTARHAFGAVAAALPDDPATLALLLIHEFQHVKLGAILDILDLYDEQDTRLFYAPWRDDPRPLEGLLQGTYAHLAVTDFWRVRRRAVPGRGNEQFARWRRQTADAVETLASSGALTPLGERFVAQMRRSAAAWWDEPVPEAASAHADRSARDHREKWAAETASPRP
ncbi:FxsB family radical SAM/SPASM domain protein [Planomonospora sp. ID67723]|uniref:FxsB family cyclophane-forming radical SAM/SPASM peptide maturase n=1 Tax=Planomonospora sp. ID67723 TaxID=2738134 RepID=UPI001A30F354|nr:FxsB family cyclophane-forming radical SAM/SPASM peptide maturase [Planomonospora sp. ID67723]MBG0826240.1 FxsB family radical SAM/SPASM domain protein [Planomonospora sp. ID67723]